MKETRTVNDLKPSPLNPRKISDEQLNVLKASLLRFGDLGGIIFNVTTGHLVGGHQRQKTLDPSWKLVKKEETDKTGTVARGYIDTPFGRLAYREVRWPLKREMAANLAANKISGEWEEEKLAQILADLEGTPEIKLTGFSEAEIAEFIATLPTPENERAHNLEEPSEEVKGLLGSRLTFLRYFGGKHMLLPLLLQLIPEHKCYVEVFGGGATVLLNKAQSDLEVYNDLDGEVVNLFETVRNDPEAFLKHADFLLHSRELYERWQQDLKKQVMCEDPVERAVRFWYLIRTGYAGHPYKGWGFTVTTMGGAIPVTMQRSLLNIHAVHDRLKSVQIDHKDFQTCIKNFDAPTTFFYLDPPYLNASDYRLGEFTLKDHEELATLLHNAEAKWLLTIGDAPEIRALYSKYHQDTVNMHVSVQKTEPGDTRDLFANLVIRNYTPPDTPLYMPAREEAGPVPV